MELNEIISIGQAIVAIKEDAQTSILGNDINRITWIDDNPTSITNQQNFR